MYDVYSLGDCFFLTYAQSCGLEWSFPLRGWGGGGVEVGGGWRASPEEMCVCGRAPLCPVTFAKHKCHIQASGHTKSRISKSVPQAVLSFSFWRLFVCLCTAVVWSVSQFCDFFFSVSFFVAVLFLCGS